MSEPATLTPRQIMDPEGTLPQVELTQDPSVRLGTGSVVHHTLLAMHEGAKVGSATLMENRRNKEAWFSGINVNKTGKGFGLATYLAAIEHAHGKGETFRTHNFTQTEAAVKVWTRFIDAGVAQVVEPFTLITEGEHAGKFFGHAQIPPPAPLHT